MKRTKLIMIYGAWLAVIAGTGCRSPAPEWDADMQAPFRRVAGRITQVDREHRFVVVRAVFPPADGAAAVVYRGRNEVARLRVAGPSHYPYISAVIEEGDPAVDDVVVW